MYDIDSIKSAASRQWVELISSIGGIPTEILDGKNHPCPKCGGVDRFRMVDKDDGAVLCNQCFKEKNGDGIAAIRWLCGWDFKDAVRVLADRLGIQLDGDATDLVAETAWDKATGADQLRAFGAIVDKRGDTPVCRIPMYDADLNQVGSFDINPRIPDLSKGKSVAGGRLGLFVHDSPKHGETVCIVEGVKDASALEGVGFKAVGLPTCRMDAAFARFFQGCHVVIVPDRDKAGIEGAEETASRLFGVAASVKVALLPADYKETGGADVRDVLRTRDGLKKVQDAIRTAKPWPAIKTKTVEIVFHQFADVCLDFITNIEKQPPLMSLGIPGVDEAIGGGVAKGEMVIIAGRPSHGKSVCGSQALDAMALGGPVLFLSQEMGKRSLAERSISGITTCDRKEWSSNKEGIRQSVEAHFKIRHPFLVVESPGTVETAVIALERAKEQHGIVAAVVDYVQLLRTVGSSRYEQVSSISVMLKEAANKLDIVLLALCQLNRQSEKGEGKQAPTAKMSDIRDSGQLEQDADVILFVEWPWRTAPDKHKSEDYLIKILKNRNRPVVKHKVNLHFEARRLRLSLPGFPPANRMPNYEPAFAGDF